jgi:hypothetical protein
MAVIIDTLEVTPVPTPDRAASGSQQQESPPPAPTEALETALERLAERQMRVWAH